MKVLIACEFSGVVRRAFRQLGHDAWSCDLLPAEDASSWHFCGNVLEIVKVNPEWDLMIAHPPCTHLAVSGARWFKEKEKEQVEAINFVLALATLPINRIALENPIGILSSRWRKPDQIIQPWQFGENETKATCLWLKNLPRLRPTNIVKIENMPLMGISAEKPYARVHREPPSDDRWKNRSRTYQGIAEAMAEQWGGK